MEPQPLIRYDRIFEQPDVQINMPTNEDRSRLDRITSCCHTQSNRGQGYLEKTCPSQKRTIAELIRNHFTDRNSLYLLAEAIDKRNLCREGNSSYWDGQSQLRYVARVQSLIMPGSDKACDKVNFYYVHKKDNQLVKKHYATCTSYTEYTEARHDFENLQFKGNENATIKAREKLLLHLFQNEFDEEAKRCIAAWDCERDILLPSPFSQMPYNDESIELFLALQRRKKVIEKVKQISALILGSAASVLLYRLSSLYVACTASIQINGLLSGLRIIDSFYKPDCRINRCPKLIKNFYKSIRTPLGSIGFSIASLVQVAVSKPFTGLQVSNTVFAGFNILCHLFLKNRN